MPRIHFSASIEVVSGSNIAKAKMRSEMRALLETTPEDIITAASAKICQHLSNAQDLLHGVKTIALYAASGREISLSGLHDLLPGMQLAYPLCLPHCQLSFHLVTRPEQLTPGMSGIPEPDPLKHEAVNLADIDLILCPGLAFGMDGSRLGQGGGYYDRSLEHFTGTTCGVTMAKQITSSIPHDDHDVHMHYLASETGILTAKSPQE